MSQWIELKSLPSSTMPAKPIPITTCRTTPVIQNRSFDTTITVIVFFLIIIVLLVIFVFVPIRILDKRIIDIIDKAEPEIPKADILIRKTDCILDTIATDGLKLNPNTFTITGDFSKCKSI